MGKRALTYFVVFFVGIVLMPFACPEVYSLPSNHHASTHVSAPDAGPCQNANHQPPHSVCYRALHDGFFPGAAVSEPIGAQRVSFPVVEDAVLSGVIFSIQLPTTRSKSPPHLALTVSFPVLRI